MRAPGVYRRRIRLTSPVKGRVAAEMEDDFHHFGVELEHDGERVTAIQGSAARFPWTTCPAAAVELQGLVGAPLATRSTAIADHIPARQNCTHMYDLAGLALAHCGVCRVRDVCLAWAVRSGERYGVWGGTTEQHRRRLIRQVA